MCWQALQQRSGESVSSVWQRSRRLGRPVGLRRGRQPPAMRLAGGGGERQRARAAQPSEAGRRQPGARCEHNLPAVLLYEAAFCGCNNDPVNSSEPFQLVLLIVVVSVGKVIGVRGGARVVP